LSSSLTMSCWAGAGLSARLVYDYNHLNDLVDGRTELDDRNRLRTTHAVMARAAYTFTRQRWSVIGLVPWVRERERNRSPQGTFENRTAGLGDIILLGRYQPLLSPVQGLALSAGLKLPTGATDIRDETTDIPLNPDLQPGTGSWDGLFVLQYDRRLAPGWWLHAFGSYTLNTPADRFEGRISYAFGNEAQVYVGVSKPVAVGGLVVRPTVYAHYRYAGADDIRGSVVPNTGGHWWYATPQVQVDWGNVGLDARAEIPLARNLTGTQLTTSYQLRFGVFYRINSGARPLNEL
jgi:hypothetical protein